MTGHRRWLALAVLLLAQLMIALDIVVVNVAAPSAQAELDIAAVDVQWIVTAYLLPFGGLLLLGGRIADYAGRKRIFILATLGFAAASAMGGAAGRAEVLFGARAAQGVFAAAMAPSLLAMLTVGFPSGHDRSRAFALFGGVSAAGGAVGLVVGGLLTEYLSWRWTLLVNVPVALLVTVAGMRLLTESRASGARHYDAPGAVLGTAGLLGVIYGIVTAADDGWRSQQTLLPLGVGLAILTVFVVWEARCHDPLVPLGLLRDRTRAGGFLACFLAFGPMMGVTLLMLVFLQGPRGEPALTAGLNFLPLAGFAGIGAALSMRVLDAVSPRVLVGGGSIIAAAGIASLARVEVTSSYVGDILPGMALAGLGASLVFITGNAIALQRIPDADSGAASGLLDATQQIGAALGVAVLTTAAVVHGNQTAYLLAGGLMLAVGLIAASLVTCPRR